MNLNLAEVRRIVKRALAEDIGTGDITTLLTVPDDSISRAEIIAKEDGVIAGLQVATVVLREVGRAYASAGQVSLTSAKADGDPVCAGDKVALIAGPTRVILTAERTLLNFMQRMSGIATKTARLVELVKHTNAQLVDTRKTAPGLRILDKYAVRAGGGGNHRFGLYDAILIKDNHIRAAGGIKQAIEAAKSGAPHTIKIEVEAENLAQVKQALSAGAEMILLDNMKPSDLRKAVALCKGRALTEASGNVNEGNIAEIAETGVDIISVGALTHSVKALDLSLEIVG
jgi:nicotinate-nucleotide pyrophosphorylase (carboxylating)